MIRFLSTPGGWAIAFGTVAASPTGLSRLRRLRGVASTIAGDLFLLAFLFLVLFGLPGLFAGA